MLQFKSEEEAIEFMLDEGHDLDTHVEFCPILMVWNIVLPDDTLLTE